MSQMLQQGDRVGSFIVERLIGRGAISEVYVVRRGTESGESFAMKVLLTEVADDDPEQIQRFVREGNLVRKMSHPNLVAVHDVGYCAEKGFYYLVMDYIAGSSLRTAIGLGGAMEPKEAIRIISCIASVLASGERYGLVHRDIKPENIMIEDGGVVKLVDFGVVKSREVDSLSTMSNTVFGTPNYISPEQATDASKVDFRADVYSLGIVLFELLTGRRPYEGRTPAEVVLFLFSPDPVPDVRTVDPTIPEDIARILSRMCEKDPEKRISSASAFIDELKSAGLWDELSLAAHPRSPSRAASEEATFDFSFDDLPDQADDTLSFETNDAEIVDFVAKLKMRRRRKRLIRLIAIAVVALLAACAVIALV